VISGREARRIGERERAKEERQKRLDAFWALSPEERAQRMRDNEAFQRISKNGITIEDLKNAEEQARKDGFMDGAAEMIKICYAAICLALHESDGFDCDKCRELLAAADERVVYAINSRDLLQEVRDTIGLEFNFKADVGEERIQEVDEA
jgi:hypothetical protein